MTIQIDKKHLLTFMRSENEKIMDLLLTFNVPDSIEADDTDDYLLTTSKTIAAKSFPNKQNAASDSIDELQQRLDRIKNKMKTKKGPQSEKAKKKKEAKKLKKNKEFKKVLVTAAKSIKNQQAKLGEGDGNDDEKESKKDIKPVVPKPVFNEEGKIVFSKFDFAQKKKKSHKNPREILREIKATDKKINELKESGEVEKALEMKNELAWKKAFDKVEGKKVKDDPKLLYKAIKKRKVEKKKAKKQWTERKQKVEKDIAARQKKRQENLDKRSKDKQKNKLKKAAKKGRVIPGF
ncbi:surfeit locus protein 6 homolog [Musca domestica]|uniref:Surfeit locus protein 6 homolog n=2 Tax=Musca domestica TaxID=7370 RepID=A0A1I8MQL8_MUSDO|nr:surfeit locus protein 6 homolog [Musca domestica]